MSDSRRRMICGLLGLAGMSRNLPNVHAQHHASRFGRKAMAGSFAPYGGVAEKVPGISGQGAMKFKVLYTSDHLPAEARRVLTNAHGGFAVDRRSGHEETYFALPGAGILQISSDLKTVNLIDTPDEMRKLNLHDTNIWYDKDGIAYLAFPANNEGKIFTTTLDGELVHRLDAPTAADKFEAPQVHDYFLKGGRFSPTAVEYLEGLYYVTTGYCDLDYVLTARVTSRQRLEAFWNDLAWGGKGDGIGQFGTGHGITRTPGDANLDVADRPHSRIERFTQYGQFLSMNSMPSGSLPCDINYLDHTYSVVPALEGPDKEKGAPIYVLENEKLISTIMIKEDLGLANFTHVHNAAIRKIGTKLYIMALAWNPGDFAILEQV
ncbi:MAG TPA: hypothetical protein VE398_13875 [Acidobacteriota bacterium]|nr:hypothetical protein [Acidobacteriota bacterium]